MWWAWGLRFNTCKASKARPWLLGTAGQPHSLLHSIQAPRCLNPPTPTHVSHHNSHPNPTTADGTCPALPRPTSHSTSHHTSNCVSVICTPRPTPADGTYRVSDQYLDARSGDDPQLCPTAFTGNNAVTGASFPDKDSISWTYTFTSTQYIWGYKVRFRA